MKTCPWIVTIVALFAAPAFAANGNVSSRSLAQYGLNGFKVMSDADGMSIRGMSIDATAKLNSKVTDASSSLTVTVKNANSLTIDATTTAKNAAHSTSATLKASIKTK